MTRKPHRLSVFSQPLDRAALLAYFLGGIVPLVGLVVVARRYAGAALLEPALGGTVLSLALLSLGSFFLLRKTTRLALGRADRDNLRLANLVESSRSLAQTGDREEVTEIATRCAAALAQARTAYFLAVDREQGTFTVLSSVGPEAAATYARHQEQIDEMVALALPEETDQADSEIVHGEIAQQPASAIGVGAGGAIEGALVLLRAASTPHDAGEAGVLTTLARLVTVALKNSDLRSEQRNFFSHVTSLLVSTLDAHLDYQTDHSHRVARLANRIGRALELEEEQLYTLHFAALLHDIGMLRIEKESLDTSRAELEKHPAIGYEMLRQIDLWRPVAPLVRHHHERYDGSGYPDRLGGEAIPIESRIIAVAEAYDSMTSPHSYRVALPPEQALDQIRQGSGTQFDPAVVRVLLELPESVKPAATGLTREIGLLGLAATGICSMLGAAINVVPFMIQRNVPGIGPHVLPAFLLAAVPAVLAAIAYSILASAMPRAGGSYVYASRALSPYLGFVASFSQWFGLSIAIGVVSYVLIPFLRDIAAALDLEALAVALDSGPVRVVLALAFLWIFVAINLRGLRLYERTLVPLMFLMFGLGAIVIVAGFSFQPNEFSAAILAQEGRQIAGAAASPLDFSTLLAAAAVLFSSFIGFDSIAQAGGEAKDPGRTLPLAIGIAVVTVGTFYLLFTAAVYHAVPWSYIAEQAQARDLTAPGLLGVLLSPGWTVAIVAGAAVALINDLPAMLLAVSRLMFAWAEDGIFPRLVARVHSRWHTPHVALVASGAMASVGILGSHLAGDFFLGVDILVTSMLVNFLVMCLSVLNLPSRNPTLAAEVKVVTSRPLQVAVGAGGIVFLGTFLATHIWKDLSAPDVAWYFRSTPVWFGVMLLASALFWREMHGLRRSGANVETLFSTLPPE